MKNFWYLIGAYSAIWVLIGYYFFNLGRKVSELSAKVGYLEEEKRERL